MPTAIDKALDFIGGMNTSASVPHTMDESTAKGILKYLNELGVPASAEAIIARGEQEDGIPSSRKKSPDGRTESPLATALLSKIQNTSLLICGSSSRSWCNLFIRK